MRPTNGMPEVNNLPKQISEAIQKLNIFAGGVAEIIIIIHQLKAIPERDNQKKVDAWIEPICSRLDSILSNKKNENIKMGKVSLSDAVYNALLLLADFWPINPLEPIYQTGPVEPLNRVVTSKRHQFDILHLIKYHEMRGYRGSHLLETDLSKFLLNPITNYPFSERDVAHIVSVAEKRGKKIKYLKRGEPIVQTPFTRTPLTSTPLTSTPLTRTPLTIRPPLAARPRFVQQVTRSSPSQNQHPGLFRRPVEINSREESRARNTNITVRSILERARNVATQEAAREAAAALDARRAQETRRLDTGNINLTANNIPQQFQKARLFFFQRNYDSALAIYNAIIHSTRHHERNFDYVEAMMRKADILVRKNLNEGALEIYHYIKERYSNSSDSRMIKAAKEASYKIQVFTPRESAAPFSGYRR